MRSPQVMTLTFILSLPHLRSLLCSKEYGLWYDVLPYPQQTPASICGFCSSVQDFAVWLPSCDTSRCNTCHLLTVQFTSACSGLSPYSQCPCWAHTFSIRIVADCGRITYQTDPKLNWLQTPIYLLSRLLFLYIFGCSFFHNPSFVISLLNSIR